MQTAAATDRNEPDDGGHRRYTAISSLSRYNYYNYYYSYLSSLFLYEYTHRDRIILTDYMYSACEEAEMCRRFCLTALLRVSTTAISAPVEAATTTATYTPIKHLGCAETSM